MKARLSAVPGPEARRPPQTPAARLNGADRVLATLKRLAAYPGGATLETLARDLGAPKSSMHRVLSVLRRADLADQDEQGRYRLGLEFVRLAFEHYEALDVAALVKPALEALVARFDETAHYAVLDGAEIVYVAKVGPDRQRIQMTSTIGGRNPAHCTGLGKALLAHALPDLEAVRTFVTANSPLTRRTERTLVTALALHRDLVRVRRRGFALDREESEIGIVCIAFPVFLGPLAAPSGAISIAALAHRTPLRRLTEAAGEIADIIKRYLGPVTP